MFATAAEKKNMKKTTAMHSSQLQQTNYTAELYLNQQTETVDMKLEK